MEGGVTPFSSNMAPSGSYILIVVSQPLNEEHKQIILQRLNKGLLSWDVTSTSCDLTGLDFTCSSMMKEQVDESDVLFQHSTESLGVEVLMSPNIRTLQQCVKNLLSTHTSHKQLIHAGYTFAGSGSWIVENGTFSFDEFLEIFQEAGIQNRKRCTINVHCTEEGDWNQTNFSKDIFTRAANVTLNPPGKVNHVPGTERLIKYLDETLTTQRIGEIMKPSPLVGNIRFNRPTMYIFPAGQGDCTLFGINGFNMLIDGGFHRKPCSWEFVRHLDRLDAVLITRISESNMCGMSTLMKRNAENNANPRIGYVFCNIAENKPIPTKDGKLESTDDLIVSVVREGHDFVQTLNDLKLKPHQCWRDSSIDPFVLYHKVGQGTLEMHILSPPRDSKEMKMFLSEWNAYKETFSGVKSELSTAENMIPLSHATSICAILVWRPEDPKDTITRILFPGSAPQNRILEGLDKLKSLNILNQPVATKDSLKNIPPPKSVMKVEKSISRASIPNRNHTASPALSVSSIASKNGDIGVLKKDVKEVKKIIKEVKKENKEVKKDIKKEIKKDVKKEIKTENAVKKESLVKKEIGKELKKETKDVKKVVKKESKEVKTVTDKKQDLKSTPKRESTTSTAKSATDAKKTSTTIKKSSTLIKKDVGKPPIAPKATDAKKSDSKVSEPKATKDVNNKKAAESKTVTKAKPKLTSTPKAPTAAKTKPVAVPKPGSKMTKAVAASSIVASAVALTAAAVELNEKKDVIEDAEPEILDKEEIIIEAKESVVNEKSVEDIVSPLPIEALSPTPSDSVSLTPSDTLSSAPLETVSPTPPLPNEPISTEEKDVNEIKDIEQDIPYELETAVDDIEVPNLENNLQPDFEVNDMEAELAKHKVASDIMSTSFISEQNLDCAAVDEHVTKTESKEDETTPRQSDLEYEKVFSEENVNEKEITEEKEIADVYEKFSEENIAEDADAVIKKDTEQKDIVEEEDSVVEKDTVDEKDIVEENYFIHDKEITDDNNVEERNIVEEQPAVQEKYVTEEKDFATEKNFLLENSTVDHKTNSDTLENVDSTNAIEDKLAGLTMEGSFCAGMIPSDNNISIPENEDIQITKKDVVFSNNLSTNDEEICKENDEEQIYEKKIISENESYFQSQTAESAVNYYEETNHDTLKLEQNSETPATELSENYELQHLEEGQNAIDQNLYESELDQSKERVEEISQNVDHDHAILHSETFEETAEDRAIHEYPFDKLSQIRSMEESFHQEAYENYEHPTNIDDLEMQETSVDEPEEIVRKESVVSITLNDENPEEQYTDSWRRKSGTESEDDVDIGKYMSKEQTVEEEKLRVHRDSDSDEEDVMKSPTPHAVVDYEGHPDEEMLTMKQGNEKEGNEEKITENYKEEYLNEKEDFDEKDRDSAEEQDTDDEEMIRHPTPPQMKYSEEEMRDPIGQHFITNPNLKAQGKDITEQPLYEEAEESGSERSISPIIEQPVFGSTAEANFPELVTVSGGTTPSEPQSPKSNFDTKKFSNEAAVMDALSEHDVSESSTHSPSCQDGSTAFDLQASETSIIEVQSLQDDQVPNINTENKYDLHLDTDVKPEADQISKSDEPSNKETKVHDENDDNQEDKQDTPSDEEESSSEDENSESHSKDKSDAMGDRSDVERDDRSDIHNDDKSDHHHDGKSDIVNDDDDDKSDIHDDEQLYRQQDKNVYHDSEFMSQDEIKSGFLDKSEIPFDNTDYAQDENYDEQDLSKNQHEEASNIYAPISTFDQENFNNKITENSESTFIEKVHTEKECEDGYTFSGRTHEHAASVVSQNVSSRDNTNFDRQIFEKYGDSDSINILQYESTYTSETHESNFEFPSTDFHINIESGVASQDLSSTHSGFKNQSDKNEDNEGSNPFQSSEVPIENSQPVTTIHGFNTSDFENEDQTASIETKFEIQISNEYSHIPSGFENSENVSFDQHEKELYSDNHYANLQKAENIDELETKILSEMEKTEHQEKILSTYENDIRKFNDEGGLTENAIPTDYQIAANLPSEKDGVSESNFGYFSSQVESYTTSNSYEYSSFATDNNAKFQPDSLYGKTDTIDEGNISDNFKNNEDYEELQGTYSHSNDYEPYTRSETQFIESHSQNTLPKEITSMHFSQEHSEMLSKDGFNSEVTDMNFNEGESSDYGMVNGKDQAAFGVTSSELTSSEFFRTELPHKENASSATQHMEQDSSYLISNRFHSDSPEDNTMRSDSSPDVPYPADLPENFSEIKNSMSVETCSETYIHSTDDYKNNMNFTTTDGIPLSPQKHSLNTNQNNTYAESSEDETNSPAHGNISPYAYTNKAYTREEEDIDGNHIYKQETTEVIKQVEFDGNNLQTLNTNQVSSVMNYSQEFQEMQYSTGANLDFHLEEWGKPMGLPTPPDASQKTVVKKSEKSTIKSKTTVDANGKLHSPSVSSKLSSPSKKPKPKMAKESSSTPIYVDLAYVPQHADPHYCDVEFFKKIRARYYVFSSVNPSKEVLNALLEAKKTWNEDLSVTIIPTYETDTLGYWMAQNENDLAEYSIEIAPSASRCTVNLQDHQTSCSAYRLEF